MCAVRDWRCDRGNRWYFGIDFPGVMYGCVSIWGCGDGLVRSPLYTTPQVGTVTTKSAHCRVLLFGPGRAYQMSSPALSNQVLLQVPLSGAQQPDLLMGKVVVVSQEAGCGVGVGGGVGVVTTTATTTNRPLPGNLQKTEEATQAQREILVNVVSTGSGTDFIVLRPEDLPGGTPGTACKNQRFYQHHHHQPLPLTSALETGNNGGWPPNPAKLLSSLSGNGDLNGRRTAALESANNGAGIRYCGAPNTNMALDGGMYAESTVVERPPHSVSDAAGGPGLRDAQVLVRPVDGKPVEAVPVATVDAYPMRPYVR